MRQRFLNRLQRRWPRPIRSRVALAKSDFTFVLVMDRIEAAAGGATPFELLRIAERAAATLGQCGVPQSEWEVRHAQD